MKIRIFFILILSTLILSSFTCYGQKDIWQNLTGINSATKILDDHPYLWITTIGGLVKFNKITGEITKLTKANAGLPGNILYSVAKNKDTIWVGTWNSGIGIGKYYGDTCIIYNPDNSGLQGSTGHSALAFDQSERLWIGSRSLITSYDGSVFKNYPAPFMWWGNVQVFQILTYKDIVYASGTWDLDSKEILTHDENPNLKFVKAGYSMVCDSKGKLYFSNDSGLFFYDNGIVSELKTSNSNIPTESLDVGGIDSNGNIWFASDLGLIKYDGSTFSLINYPDGYTQYFRSMCIDKENTIWLVGESENMYKFKNNSWEIINLNTNLPYSGWGDHSFEYDKNGNLWISTKTIIEPPGGRNSLLKYDGIHFVEYTKSELVESGAQIIYEDSQRYILSMSDVLFDFSDSIWNVYDLKNNNEASKFIKDNEGFIWETTRNGLKKYEKKNYTLFTTDNSNLITNRLNKMAVKNDSTFIISNYAGGTEVEIILFEFNLKKGSNILYRSNYSDLINSFVVDKTNNIWFGRVERQNEPVSGMGLFRIRGRAINRYTTSNSDLPSNAVNAIHIDSSGELWVNANSGGVVRINGNDWTIYNLNNSGFPSPYILDITSKDNLITFLSLKDGITIFAADSMPINFTHVDKIKRDFPGIKVYPNPAKDVIFLEFDSNPVENMNVKIYDLSGRLLQKVSDKACSVNNHTLRIPLSEELNPYQLYIVKIIADGKVYSEKFIHIK